MQGTTLGHHVPAACNWRLEMKKTLALTTVVFMCVVYGAEASSLTFSDTAVNAAGITTIRDAFRTAIGGGVVAGANGSFGGVRREINWDGVPDLFSAPNLMPPDFFNVNSPRGAVFSTPGSGFEVSANAGIAPIEFGNIDATYPTVFATFSPQRLFTAIGSNITDVRFFVAGTNTPAVTSAFGAIFTDVDTIGSSLQFFDVFNNSLGTFAVPSLIGNETFEFLGVIFDSPVISRVRITSGNAALGAGINDGGAIDLAVMDDFLYAEPQAAVPEPTSLLLLGSGLIAIRWYRGRRA
jgi:PEP-CTERM motif